MLGVAPATVVQNVCRRCFMNTYGCSHGYIDGIVKDIKEGVRSYDRACSDKNRRVSLSFTSHLVNIASYHGVTLTRKQIQAMTVPNTVESLSAFAWMSTFFDVAGEQQPNIDEIHLDPCSVDHIWEEYRCVMEDAKQDYIKYSHFLHIWKQCFPHVKVREYKAVTGKCRTCAALSLAKRQKLDMATRKYLNELTSLHRSFYMGERLEYYSRRNDAFITPSLFMSIIADGMQQGHCLLPWQANQYQYTPHLPQHIQGVVNHGRHIKIYRTFHNVSSNANLSVHCLLKTLEVVREEEERIPDVLYYQVDGGSENTAEHVFGVVALIVAKSLTKKIVISRLPVGHTHEDIDSKFAFIWKRVRNNFVLTPLAYKRAIESSLTNDRAACEVIDIFAVPNYEKYIEPYIIPDFGRYARLSRTGDDWTQLQFIFDAVPISNYFPCGVRTTYRKFSADMVVLIEEETAGRPENGFIVKDAEIHTYPKATANGAPAGFSMLTALPPDNAMFEPDPFVLGSRAVLDAAVAKVKRFFRNQPDVIAEWVAFADAAPKSDCAQAYCNDNPLDIPLQVFC